MDSHWCRYTLCIDYSHRLLPIFIVSITWQGGGGIYSGGGGGGSNSGGNAMDKYSLPAELTG